MSRRVSLPGASELFRDTTESGDAALAQPASEVATPITGRVRHDEKITVYVSTDELLALESARLALRSQYGLAVDRGRIVRAAIAMAMDDLTAAGAESELLRRLSSP